MTNKGYWNKVFRLDFRSLALFRVGLGFILLLDLWVRSRSLTEHYTDQGVLPRAVETTVFNASWYFSFHNSMGSTSGQAVLFSLNALCAFALLIGFRTRLATFLCWIFLISLENRNYLILNAGDVYLRLLLFWSMFLPLGYRASVDAALQQTPLTKEAPEENFFSAGTIALTLQIIMIYFFSGLLKAFEPIWQNGLGLYFALSAEIYATELGKWVSSHYQALVSFNPWVLWLELLSGFLLLIPYRNDRFRSLCILFFWAFHLTIAALLEVGFLSTIGVVAWMIFIPSSFWTFLESHLTRFQGEGLNIQYDEDCDLCLKMLRLLIPILGLKKAQLIPAKLGNSWIVTDQNAMPRLEFDAFCFVFEKSVWGRFLAPLMRTRPIFFLGTKFYRWFAQNRSSVSPYFFKWNERSLLYGRSKSSCVLAVLSLLAVFVLNVVSVPRFHLKLPYAIEAPLYFLRLDQNWLMFRSPLVEDGWYTIPGILKDGSKIDLYRQGRPYSAEKPALISSLSPNDRFRKFYTTLYENRNPEFLLAYGRFLCAQLNTQHVAPDQLISFQIIFRHTDTQPEGGKGPPLDTLLWSHRCFD